MANRRTLLAVAVAVVAVVVVGLLWWAWRANAPLPEPKSVTVPDAIPIEKVELTSPDLEVLLVGMRGTVNPDFTDWACFLECREREGCRADIQLTVEYQSGGVAKQFMIGGRLDGDPGEIMRVGRVQRPPVEVDSIDRVSMTVLEVHRANSPRPTEIE